MKATRDAYGEALVELGGSNTRVVVLDADLPSLPSRRDLPKNIPKDFLTWE